MDEVLDGGLPVGALTELVGSECSGRTGLALSFLTELTGAGKVCAWIDASNSLNPESAAAVDLDLSRLLWVRCGVATRPPARPVPAKGFVLPAKYLVAPPVKKGLHGGSFGQHPHDEAKGLSNAISDLLRSEAIAPRCAEPQRRVKAELETFTPGPMPPVVGGKWVRADKQPLNRIAQALQATDLLLQAGGFSAATSSSGARRTTMTPILHTIACMFSPRIEYVESMPERMRSIGMQKAVHSDLLYFLSVSLHSFLGIPRFRGEYGKSRSGTRTADRILQLRDELRLAIPYPHGHVSREASTRECIASNLPR